MIRKIALFLIFAPWAFPADSLEKQADQAVEHAAQLTKSLKADEEAGKWQVTLDEIANSVESANKLFKDSGKSARKSPKYFKRAELKTREIARRLDAFGKDVSVDDREAVEKVRARVQAVHDQILAEIMGTK
jgi:hypothetical protein